MTKRTVNVLWGYAILLPLLAVLVHRLWPDMMQWTLVAGVGGGLLMLVWALIAATGGRVKKAALLSLIPVCFVLLSQAVMCWMADGGFEQARHITASALVTLMVVLTVAALMSIAYDGAFDAVNSTDHRSSAHDQDQQKPGVRARTRHA